MKKILFLLAASFCAVGAWAATTLYLNTGGSSLWGTENPDFYVYAFNNSANTNYKMTLVEGDIYAATIDETTYSTVIFVRLDPSATSFDWGKKWNQTVDLAIPTDGSNCYKMTSWESGQWTTYTAQVVGEDPWVAFNGVATEVKCGATIELDATIGNFSDDPAMNYSVKVPGSDTFDPITGTSYTVPNVVGVYTLKVVASILGSETAEATMDVTAKVDYYLAGSGLPDLSWDANSLPMYDGSILFTDVASGTKVSLKVTNGTWDQNWGIAALDADCSSDGVSGTDNVEFTTSTVCDVKIAFDATTGKICVTGDFGGTTEITSYTIVGETALMGSNYDTNDAANEMTLADGVWTLVKTDVALETGTYYYKVCGNHDYNQYEYPASGNLALDIAEDGYYTVTFTLKPGAEQDVLTAVAAKTGELPVENLTFSVTVPEGTSACYIAGNFTEWQFVAMTKVDDTHYTAEFAVKSDNAQYKYACAADWNSVEIAADGSDISNRAYTAADVVARWKATPTALAASEALNAVYARDGRIYADEGARIYTVSGLDVTRQNGQLNGLYIVKIGDKATKIVAR